MKPCRLQYKNITGAFAAAVLLGAAVNICYAQQTGSNTIVGPGGSSPTSTTTATKPGPSVILPTGPASNFGSGWLENKVETHLGRPIDHLVFTVTNKSRQPIEYDFTNGQQYDFVVTNSMGKEVWTWSHSQVFPQLMTRFTLAPKHSKTFEANWDRRDNDQKPVPPGKYTAVATLTSMPRLVVAKTTTINPTEENRDPTNVTVASPQGQSHSTQYGGQEESDVAPPVIAKTTITVPSQ